MKSCPIPSLILTLALLSIASCSSNPGPPPSATVTAATDLGAVQTNSDIVGRDGAYSGVFQGYSVWLYGDTFLANPDVQGRTFMTVEDGSARPNGAESSG